MENDKQWNFKHMELSNSQSKYVKKYNKDVKSGITNIEFVPCLCGQDDPRKFDKIYRDDRYGLWCPSVICKCCGLVQLNPRLTPSEYTAFYQNDHYRRLYGDEDYINNFREKYKDPYNRHIFDILDPIMKKLNLNKVLEFGCAGGWKLLPFHESGYQTAGYDFSPSMVALGREYGLDLNEGTTHDVKGGPYEVIILNHVAEHLTDFFNEMKNILDHLEEGGLIYVGVPDIVNFDKSQFQNAHTLYFTPRTLKRYMRVLGYKTVDFGHIRADSIYGVFTLDKNKNSQDSFDSDYPYMKKVIMKGKLTGLVRNFLLKIGLKEIVYNLIRRLR
jgi:2-polyprenyl-3-methyl-5-hydroxy-6-metoxy-1,4-benzoquinol methylase